MIATSEQLERRIYLQGISWEMYESLRNAKENYHLRMTYDRGALEIVSPSRQHERISYLLGRMIDQWTLFKKIDIAAGRNTTFRRQDLKRGLEPDNCYWVSHEPQMRRKDDVDLRIDPPPDLVLEVDVTWSSIPKIPIYAELGVPEVWHWNDEDVLEVLHLGKTGTYKARPQSHELPKFPFTIATDLIQKRYSISETALISEFIKSTKEFRRK
jgi:Uma2 family endonuclease